MKTTMFKDDMYQAVLEDRKTHTRRLNGLQEINKNPYWYEKIEKMCVNKKGETVFIFGKKDHWINFDKKAYYIKCPYKVGDVIGIKESFHVNQFSGYNDLDIDYLFDSKRVIIKLDDSEYVKYLRWKRPFGNKSKLFMFDSLIRNKIEIKDIRVERVQDISEKDAVKEGVPLIHSTYGTDKYQFWTGEEHACNESAKVVFMYLWDSINKKRGYGWDKNSWVFVYEFKRIEQ